MTNNYTHLSYEDRINIEDGLNNKLSINQIAKDINRSHSTILREIQKNKVYHKSNSMVFMNFNNPNYTYDCEKLNKSPYVCNGCPKRRGCRKHRYTYYARKANDCYKDILINSRKGINLTLEEVFNINKIITPLVKKGQTINHLYINHPDILNFSKVSFYNYIHNGVFEFGPLDLPRIVKYKKRKNIKRRTRAESEIRINRTYDYFLQYIIDNPDLNIVEMDTVEGLKSEHPCLLTLLWRKSKFMLIFYLNSQTKDEVSNIFKYIQQLLPIEDYKRLFPTILTDNGKEFFCVDSIEKHCLLDEKVTKLFYCDPSASCQKGMLEKNHEFIRYVLPKKTSFRNLNQDKCSLLANHINSLYRESLNNNCPYKAMQFICDDQILKLFNCHYIHPDDIQLNKQLLK